MRLTPFRELLAYDCRLMNVAASQGHGLLLRDWLSASDEDLSPQAAVLSPAATYRIAEAIVNADTQYQRTIAAGIAAVCELRERAGIGRLKLSAKEKQWLDRNFRNVNNTLGHSRGDDAIRLYLTIVKEVLGTKGEIYRRGGDEIVVFAPRLDAERAARLEETLRSEVESQFRAWAKQYGLDQSPTASIGLVLSKGMVPINEVIARMDAAQHEAKRQGKNRLVIG